jgi:hypothetical protein
MKIIVGDPVYLTADEVGGNVLYLTCGDTSVDGASFYFGAFQHNGAGGDNGIASDLNIVHDNGAHTDQHLVL